MYGTLGANALTLHTSATNLGMLDTSLTHTHNGDLQLKNKLLVMPPLLGIAAAASGFWLGAGISASEIHI